MKYYIIIYDGITNNKTIQKCALVPVPPLLSAKSLGDDEHMTSALRGRGHWSKSDQWKGRFRGFGTYWKFSADAICICPLDEA